MEIYEQITGFFSTYYLLPVRFVYVALIFFIVVNLKRQLLKPADPKQILAVLDIKDGAIRLPITHYETTIGRSKACDVVIPLKFISRQHAVLTMTRNGLWRIKDTGSTGGILINGEEPENEEEALVGIGDEVSLAGMKMVLNPPTIFDIKTMNRENRKRKIRRISEISIPFLLTSEKEGSTNTAVKFLNMFQILAFLQLAMVSDSEHLAPLAVTFGFLLAAPWCCKLIAKILGIKNMSAEVTAFFLTTIGICTTASASPDSLYKQLAAVVLGLIFFCIMCGILKNLNLVMKLRRYMAALSILTLAANLFIGVTINGQKNWIDLGFTTVQPSEFVKVLFVFSGAATLEWLLTTKNLAALTGYAVGCMGLLFLMGDFGTALIFFSAFIVLIFMTSGDLRAIALTIVTAGLGAFLVIGFKPYITLRFAAWRNVWAHVFDTGFQQTRALMAIASGGMLGLGGGNGFLKNIYAADTDIVFGLLVEEWGMLIAIMAVSCYVLFMFTAIRSHQTSYSSYYVIAACTAASIFMVQASLNIFGTTDVFPMTGVTLPFISNGGSSMAASWGMLSFITAALNYAKPKIKSADQNWGYDPDEDEYNEEVDG